jgi:uncharacterized membrane protein YkvA (DUF1232 family)
VTFTGADRLVRVVPDLVRLVRRLLTDHTTPLGVRLALIGLLAWLVNMIDLIPEFVPVLRPLDDVIVAVLVLRDVRRRLGHEELRRRWPGSPDGYQLLSVGSDDVARPRSVVTVQTATALSSRLSTSTRSKRSRVVATLVSSGARSRMPSNGAMVSPSFRLVIRLNLCGSGAHERRCVRRPRPECRAADPDRPEVAVRRCTRTPCPRTGRGLGEFARVVSRMDDIGAESAGEDSLGMAVGHELALPTRKAGTVTRGPAAYSCGASV